MAKKLKDVVKQNPEPARGSYKDPGQLGQYSAQNQVAEASTLNDYLKSKGINPNFVSKDTKISHAKSSTFQKWRNDHKFESVEHIEESALLDKYLSAHGINPQYLPKDKKIAHSKSHQFQAWMKQHMHESLEEAKTIQGTALDKFRAAAAQRAKQHDEIQKATEKRQAAGKEDMKGSIDRLEKHLTKEHIVKTGSGYKLVSKKTGKNLGTATSKAGIEKREREVEYFKHQHEEVVNEMDKSQKGAAGWNIDDYPLGAKGTTAKPTTVKNVVKSATLDLDAAFNQADKKKSKTVKEDNFADPQAATQSPFDGANNTDDTHEILQRKREMSKSARIIKSLYKRKGVVKEEIYDHEKDDKNQTSLGKKVPKLEKEDPNALPNGEPKARAVMSGGTTMTGEKRDTVEIDPQMKARPDLNGNKKDDNIVNKKLDK